MGKEKRKNNCCQDYAEKGRHYRGWPQKTFPTYESSLGGEEKSKRKEVNSAHHLFSSLASSSPDSSSITFGLSARLTDCGTFCSRRFENSRGCW